MTVIEIALNQSITQSQALDAMKTIEQIIINSDNHMKKAFHTHNIAKLICDMFIRVEENIVLLQPQMHLNKPDMNNSSNVNVDANNNGNSNSTSKYIIDESFYVDMMAYLINIIVNESIVSVLNNNSNNQKLFMHENFSGAIVVNIHMLIVLQRLLMCAEPKLITISIKIIYTLLKANQLNYVCFEASGIIHALCVLFGCLCLYGRLPKLNV